MTLEDKQRRGGQARRLLDDPLLNEALDALDADIIALWRKETDTENRERLHSDFLASSGVGSIN